MSSDEVWTTCDGREMISVGEMTEDHAKNTLRMLIRKSRRLREKQALRVLYRDLPFPDEGFFERPDNHQELAALRARHGDAVRVEREAHAGMSGGNVYVNGVWRGWYGGI